VSQLVAEPKLTKGAILAERMSRQRIGNPLGVDDDPQELISAIQPLSTGPFARPASPPRLAPRTDFDDMRATDRLRRDRTLVKGRFQGGGIGYVLARELEIYANAFRKPLVQPSEIQGRVLDAVRSTGPLTPRQLKEETGLLNKQIMPALQRLQTAFLVYEDQLDDDWERSWYDFGAEWPGVSIGEEHRESAVAEVLGRFLHAHVFATLEQIRDWSRIPARQISGVLHDLEVRKLVHRCTVSGVGEGYRLSEDEAGPDDSPPPGVFILHRADFLVRSHASELKRRFPGREVLQYLLVDGELLGAVCGRWGFHPYDVEDIALDLPPSRVDALKSGIVEIVRVAYPKPRHRIIRYAGKPI
jgi:hypothetical protein